MLEKKSVVLVVDDAVINLTLASSLLKEFYKVKVATNGQTALEIIQKEPPDLILLDVMMPVMDGYTVCAEIKSNPAHKDIPIIFLTAKNDLEDEKRGFELGAVDYIIKPLSPPLLLSRVKAHIEAKHMRDYLKDQNSYLESEINKRIQEVALIQEVSIVALASLAETRDNETGEHIQRTAEYVSKLAEKLQADSRFATILTNENIRLMAKSAPLHDIGKVGIPDRILLKPGRLTPEEFTIMKTHTVLGKEAIDKAEKLLGASKNFLVFAKEIVHSHHEKWDGSGYPEGLKGEQIPLSARLMAVADVYDALISKRVYKEAMPHFKAVDIIAQEAGKHFDPLIVETFLAIADQFNKIAEKYS